MAHGLPAKLMVTQALLGCATRKELCARFRDLNPRTEFDLERSHKWMQGRAKPRSQRVYEDWARLLGTERPPPWLIACTVDAFVDEVCRVFMADPVELKRRAGLDGAQVDAGLGRASTHYVCGAYAAYSLAWSPYHQGLIIRGALQIEPGRGNRFAALYREDLSSGVVELRGVANLVGRILHLELHEAGSGAPFYVSVFLSGRPASMLSGVASGATLAGPDPQPSSTRIVLIRAPGGEQGLVASNGYLDAGPAAIAANLQAVGIEAAQADAAAAELALFLCGGEASGLTQVNQAVHARLAGIFDAAESRP